jgi:hypothetical protein
MPSAQRLFELDLASFQYSHSATGSVARVAAVAWTGGLICWAAGLGCSTGSEPSKTHDRSAGVSAANFCAELRQERFCEARATCNPNFATLQVGIAGCSDKMRATCLERFAGQAYKNGAIQWDPLAAAAFIDQWDQALSTCGSVQAPAPGVGQGTLPAGAGCSASGGDPSTYYACGAGLACNSPNQGFCAPAAKLGESCAEQPCDVAGGQACDGITQLCVTVKPAPLVQGASVQ